MLWSVILLSILFLKTCFALNVTEMNNFHMTLFMGNCRTALKILKKQSNEDRKVFVNYVFKHKGEESALMRGIRIGRVDIAKHLLHHGADPLWKNSNGESAIMYAAMYDMYDIFIYLEKKGVTFMTTDSKSQTLLVKACLGGSLKISKYLIEGGYRDIEVADKIGRNPLIAAVESNSGNSSAIVELLLGRGVNIEKRDYRGFTPLLTAVRMNNNMTFKTLFKAGANLYAINSVPADIAVYKPEFDFKKQPQNDFKSNALIIAAKYTNSVQMVKYLVETLNFTKINDLNYERENALTWAVYHKNYDLVKYLMDIGVDPLVSDKHGDNAVTLSVRSLYRPVFEYFKGKGLLSSIPGVLEAATAVNNITIAQEILPIAPKQAVDYVNPFTKASAIHWSTRFRNYDMLKWLLDNNATISEISIFNTVRKNWAKGFNLLSEKKADFVKCKKPLLYWAIMNNNTIMLRALIAKGVSSGIRNSNNESPFFLAVRLGNMEAVQILLANHVDIIEVNKLKEPSWTVAERYGHFEIRDFLVKQLKSNPDIINFDGLFLTAPSYPLSDLEDEYEERKSR